MSASNDSVMEQHRIRTYWEERAQRFAFVEQGRPAVCSYGMPDFYNRYIDYVQRLALQPWISRVRAGSALDVGCGVGRWSMMLAARGVDVTGVDLSATMVAEAASRAARAGLAERCAFRTADAAELQLQQQFEAIFVVTVLQHIRNAERFEAAINALDAHLAPGGTIVALEAAPTRRTVRCDHEVFEARGVEDYLSAFRRRGLELVSVSGVDPAPFKTAYLPFHKRLPGPLGWLSLGLVTALSLPIDAVLGRRWTTPSWHKLIVFRKPADCEG